MEDLLKRENLDSERLLLASFASDWNSLLSSTFANLASFFPSSSSFRLKNRYTAPPPLDTLTSEGFTELAEATNGSLAFSGSIRSREDCRMLSALIDSIIYNSRAH
jgi:hypothetical protein